MFREMRRKNQELSPEECKEILCRANDGVLAVSGDDGYPYAVPLNFVYSGDKIYFHCAKSGHKLDAITQNDKVSFCVVDKSDVLADALATSYKSVIVFGRARIIEDKNELIESARLLGLKFNPDTQKIDDEIDGALNALCCVEISPEHITGKESLDLYKQRAEKM